MNEFGFRFECMPPHREVIVVVNGDKIVICKDLSAISFDALFESDRIRIKDHIKEWRAYYEDMEQI